MTSPRALRALSALAAAAALVVPATAAAQHEMPPPGPGFLEGPGEWGKIELIATEVVTNQDDLVADVAVDPSLDYAYLANWSDATCAETSEAGGRNAPDAGVWVVDISDPENPEEVGFIAWSQDSRPGEGMQALEVDTKWFTGTLLVANNEQCGLQGKGGVSLFDVSDPLKPKKLSTHFGDRGFADFQDIHSAFAWQAGENVYVVMTDNAEATDVDILDITNPKRPRLIAEFNLNTFIEGGIDQPDLGLSQSFLHDMVVKEIDGRFIMLLSYWDGGFVALDVTDPTNPVYLYDTEFAEIDPELAAAFPDTMLPPEGNAHQAEFSIDNEFFFASDEDFSPYRSIFTVDTGPNAGEFMAGEFGWTEPIVMQEGQMVSGVTVFGGYGCPESTDDVPTAAEIRAQEGLSADTDVILVLERGPVDDPRVSYESCFFSQKVEFAQNLGYDAVIIANHHVGAQSGEAPDAHFCGSMGHEFEVTIPGICIGHRAMHLLFGLAPSYDYAAGNEPVVGAIGEMVTMEAMFDGWGYVHLFDAETGEELDTFAIDEAHDPDFAFGFGDLTVHEVAVDPQDPSLAYLSYYSGGLRAIQIQCPAGTPYDPDDPPADKSTCELVEVGGYLSPEGNDFWGVETFVGDDGRTYILGSDRDSGLWIFADP
jgi:hypothetical protein